MGPMILDATCTVRLSGTKLANLALWREGVRILIFDDPAELYERQRPQSGSREGKLSNPRRRAARARCMNFFSKIYEIPRAAAARAWCASSLPVKYTVVVGPFDTCKFRSHLIEL
jgi:hypothetical protein